MKTPIDGAIPHTIMSFIRTAIDQYCEIRPTEEKERLQALTNKLFTQKHFMDSGVEVEDPRTVILSIAELKDIRVAYKLYKATAENLSWNDSVDEIMDVVQDANNRARNAIKEMLEKKLQDIVDAKEEEDDQQSAV